MKPGAILVFGLLLLSLSFSAYFTEWTTPNLARCLDSAFMQSRQAYDGCLANCEMGFIGSFLIGPIVRAICIGDCIDNFAPTRVNPVRHTRCVVGCHDLYANSEYGECSISNGGNVSKTIACYMKTNQSRQLGTCLVGCQNALGIDTDSMTALENAQVLCAERLVPNVTETVGFLFLPFESTDGLKINVGWDYTNKGESCGNYTSNSFHGAIDLDKVNDTNVMIVAAAPGNVTEVVKDCGECKSGYGAYVKMRVVDSSTNTSYLLVYGHMQNNSILVEKNQQLVAGDHIGLLGTTGNSTGTHLHFEVRQNENYNQRVDPYDIRSIDECEYPGWSNSFKDVTCGPNYLWTECPPVPR